MTVLFGGGEYLLLPFRRPDRLVTNGNYQIARAQSLYRPRAILRDLGDDDASRTLRQGKLFA